MIYKDCIGFQFIFFAYWSFSLYARIFGLSQPVSIIQLQAWILLSSVADPERFDADPDPTFRADADPDPTFRARDRKTNVFKSSNYFFPKYYQTCHV